MQHDFYAFSRLTWEGIFNETGSFFIVFSIWCTVTTGSKVVGIVILDRGLGDLEQKIISGLYINIWHSA